MASDGVYRTADHLAQLRREETRDPQATVDVHVRRLEALRRAGIVERQVEGVWRVPRDLMQRVQQHDAQKGTCIALELRSHLPIGRQVRAFGATWLDRQLVGDGKGVASLGFGAQVREAMNSRVDFLSKQGLAERRGQRVVLARNLLATLRDRELAQAGNAIQAQTGLIHRALNDGERASGIYRRSIQLASGRFAMLDDGLGFSLVPWRLVVERRLDQQVAAVVRGQAVTWELGRQRGLSI